MVCRDVGLNCDGDTKMGSYTFDLPHFLLIFQKTMSPIRGDSRGKVSVVGGDRIRNYEKRVHMNMCIIMNGYRDKICLHLQIQKRCEW
jgi:hypothetical protein